MTSVHHSLVHMDAAVKVDNKVLYELTLQQCGHPLEIEVCENQVLS